MFNVEHINRTIRLALNNPCAWKNRFPDSKQA
jgi:hypothetical protein